MNLEISDGRLEVAVEAAVAGGDLAASKQKTAEVSIKSDSTVVTEADRAAEESIRRILGEAFSYPVVGEEYGGAPADDTYWVVDPIDGTNNFSSQQPLFGTAIGLVSEGEVEVGVIYMPRLEYLFYAVSGCGAYLNGDQISVREGRSPSESKFVTSGWKSDEYQSGVTEVTRWVQRFGCAVMTLSWVAAGWSDCGFMGGLAPWDMVAGVVLVREAGGVVRDIKTGSESWSEVKSGGCAFGDAEVVSEVIEVVDADTLEGFASAEYPS